jgi:hypothetical protein
MPDRSSPLWPTRTEIFFRDRQFEPQRQEGPTCVATVLGTLTGQEAGVFVGRVNTQDPRAWSAALAPSGLRLAYCPTDARKLEFYREELIDLDDLFTLSYYTPDDPAQIFQDPDQEGWVCGSHVVLLHRHRILDPASGLALPFEEHPCVGKHTKRIFRVVPAGDGRGL